MGCFMAATSSLWQDLGILNDVVRADKAFSLTFMALWHTVGTRICPQRVISFDMRSGA